MVRDTEPIAIEGLRGPFASAGGPSVVAAERSLMDAINAVRDAEP